MLEAQLHGKLTGEQENLDSSSQTIEKKLIMKI
jgi:hypothetical protein